MINNKHIIYVECCVREVPYACLGACFSKCKGSSYDKKEANNSKQYELIYNEEPSCSSYKDIITKCCIGKKIQSKQPRFIY